MVAGMTVALKAPPEVSRLCFPRAGRRCEQERVVPLHV